MILLNSYTICPRSSDPFYIVTYYIKYVTTSWTDGKYYKINALARQSPRHTDIDIERQKDRVQARNKKVKEKVKKKKKNMYIYIRVETALIEDYGWGSARLNI